MIPRTTIPIDTTQCSSNSTQSSDACSSSAPPTTEAGSHVIPSPAPSSVPTCLAMQQVASRNSLGMSINNCAVSNGCSKLTCTYLNLFPFSVTILPCNTPPAIEFSVNDTDGNVLVDETVSRTRNISVDALGQGSVAYITVDHPCGRSAMVVEVSTTCVLVDVF